MHTLCSRVHFPHFAQICSISLLYCWTHVNNSVFLEIFCHNSHYDFTYILWKSAGPYISFLLFVMWWPCSLKLWHDEQDCVKYFFLILVVYRAPFPTWTFLGNPDLSSVVEFFCYSSTLSLHSSRSVSDSDACITHPPADHCAVML